MQKNYSLWGFYVILVCLSLMGYSIYSNIQNMWLIAPPNYILLLMSVTAFILGILGWKSKRKKMISTITIVFSSLASICLLFVVTISAFASGMGANEKIKSVTSPNDNYTVDFYQYDAGAAGSFGIRGEINGPLWFKKRIFYQNRLDHVDVDRESDEVIKINYHTLNVAEGETYGY